MQSLPFDFMIVMLYLFFTICAVNVASETTLSPTNTYPFIEDTP